MNKLELLSLVLGLGTVASALFLGATGAVGWDVALPLVMAGLGTLGIHPAINKTPSA